jgi:tripartite-type tricarboxylate transporter receptor subunit TctC
MSLTSRNHLWAIAVALALPAVNVVAQDYPSKPLRILIPFTAGGLPDIFGRLLGNSMQPRLKQAVIVENRPGAGSAIGIGAVVNSAPDGYTLLVTGASSTQLRFLQKGLPFDPVVDLKAISQLVDGTGLIVTNRQTGIKSWPELVKYARANPGKLNYGSSGPGSVELAIEAIKSAAEVPLTEISYKGFGDYLPALLRNDIQVSIGDVGGFRQQILSGDVVPLLAVGHRRHQDFPAIPTIDELGYGDVIHPYFWLGFFAPKATPQSIVDKLYGEVRYFVSSPDSQKQAVNHDVELIGSSPEDFSKMMDTESKLWARVARATKLIPQ